MVLLYTALLPSSLLSVSPVFTTSRKNPEPCGEGLGDGEGFGTSGEGDGDCCLSEVVAGLGLGELAAGGLGEGAEDSTMPVPGW
jgi:hypothetical protein